MKILVTGASGFIGRALVKKLLERRPGGGPGVRVLLRGKPAASAPDAAEPEVFIGDVTDPRSLTAAVDGVDVIYHLAGVVGYSGRDRGTMERVNVGGTRNVVAAAKGARRPRLVHMSTVAAVGAAFDGREPLTEDSPYNLHELGLGYAKTKRDAESLVLAAAERGEIDAVAVNPSNIYGPGDAQKDSRRVQVEVARGRVPFYTSGGVSVVHRDDVVDGLIAAAERGRAGERYILSGDNWTIQELFARIAECAGAPPPRRHLPDFVVRARALYAEMLERVGREGPVSPQGARVSLLYHWFDCAKAKKELGFRPRPAIEAVRDSVHWMRENGLIESLGNRASRS